MAFTPHGYRAGDHVHDEGTHVIRRLLTAVFILAALAAVSGAARPADASPVSTKKARLREVQAQLTEMGMQVEQAVERYNQAAARLDSTEDEIAENRRLLAAAQQRLELARRHLTARARDMYKTPQTDFADVLFRARSFDDLVAQVDLLQRVGDSDADLVRSVRDDEREIRDRRAALLEDEKAARKLLDERETQKQDVLAQEADMRSVEAGLQTEIKRLVEAQRRAAELAAQRAAAAAAAPEELDGATAGGPAPPDPGGPGHPEVVAIAQRYLGIPYLWGGASPKTGFDCSGLVLYVYAQVGIQLSHGATDQQRASRPVPLNALQPGDLVFYGNAAYSYHVAIYVGGGQVIEAPRTGSVVSYDGVDDAWIGGRF
jgi:cell wall-associated NlpC family hydrolase